MADDRNPHSIKELLRELAILGVDIQMLQEAGLSEDELRGLLDGVRRLSGKVADKESGGQVGYLQIRSGSDCSTGQAISL